MAVPQFQDQAHDEGVTGGLPHQVGFGRTVLNEADRDWLIP